jgi:hypothetical protein
MIPIDHRHAALERRALQRRLIAVAAEPGIRAAREGHGRGAVVVALMCGCGGGTPKVRRASRPTLPVRTVLAVQPQTQKTQAEKACA